jgi:Putative zinc-finger
MKCDDCLNVLEAYVDGEAGERNVEQVRAHLTKCESCTLAFEALTAETESYARYDRELQISPAVWNGIAARIAAEGNGASRSKFSVTQWFAGLFAIPSLRFAMPAAALALIAVIVGVAYWRTRPEPPKPAVASSTPPSPTTVQSQPSPETPLSEVNEGNKEREPVLVATKPKRSEPKNRRADNQSDVLFADTSYTDLEDKDTANHLEQAQNLLISVRSIQLSDDDQEIDVSYEKAESRRLLDENIVLRRDAEMAGKFPAKTMLGSLEPFLIDIANLPDKAAAKDVRQIRDRVEKSEIVAELRAYD